MKTRILAVAVMFAVIVPVSFAQRGINQRRANQQQRIGQGVRSGSLTAGEAARLERREARLNNQVRRMKSDGEFTAQERWRVQHEQNVLSRQIYREKHDNQVQPPVTGPITARNRAQQMRIGQGIQNGSLTAAEAARLERQEANLNRREAHMASNGLTRGERRAITVQQNNMSRRIYRQKHDGQHR
ncbi:MAG: hypothetical protein ACE14L_07630 [Terriglobales bacterium]